MNFIQIRRVQTRKLTGWLLLLALGSAAAPGFISDGRLKPLRVKSAAWLGSIDADPVRIRQEKGMKGKKHFVEMLHAYLYLYHLADDAPERTQYRNKVAQLAKLAERPEYHNLAAIPLAEFREDSTSYLNACYVLQLFGLETGRYKAEIKKVLPRILEDMPRRGVNQQMAFRFLLDKLGFGAPFRVDDLIPHSVIRAHRPLEQLSVNQQYDITHEIFPLGEFGRKKITAFSPEDMDYLRQALPAMVRAYVAQNNIDLLAEVLVCMRFLDFETQPEYQSGLDYVLAHQNANGSFGNYERERQQMRRTRPQYDVDIGAYLHTTEVCLWALAEAVKKGAARG